MAKVTFDGVNKIIIVNNGENSIDVKTDIYSEWKIWIASSYNAKFFQAIRVVGGDPTVGSNAVAPYFFLTNGWKIRPYEGNHTLNISGNLFVDEPGTYGYNITIPTEGYFQVLVNMSTTSDATIVTGAGALNESDIVTLTNSIWDELLANHVVEGSLSDYIAKTRSELQKHDKISKALKFV